ncbi:peptidoglycan-binding protein [Candidatus Peregrinibacteria bacterium]|nr:peptidoglycan-binding protein [Candidatus Peregrinibacteria bacterium]
MVTINNNFYHYYKQVKLIFLIALGIISFFALFKTAYSSYQQTFTISAYYSPLPGQTRYVTGSYEGDIRLNGNGVHSADGTQVYPGMIAAPSSYAFGTKMNIPGIGIVAVHDRGGAIVHAGQRGHAYDRLDVWMGYGDQGLSRALTWGKRTVNVTVYGIDPNIKENVYLEGFSIAEKFVQNIIVKQKVFTQDLWYGVSGDRVGTLQDYLRELGYYQGKSDKYFGDEVYKALLAFQIDQGIVDSEQEFGAGFFGPQTRSKIEAVFEKRKKDILPVSNLGKNDAGDEVKKLQEALKKLGFDVEVTGIYDEQTIEAVFEFQKENQIIDHEEDLGAGFFGPKTFAKLSEKLASFYEDTINDSNSTPIVKVSYTAFTKDLNPGDSGDEVKMLQQELTNMNLFRTSITGYYGDVTKNAVFKYQQKKGIVENTNSSGSGVFGPKTRDSLNQIIGYRANNKVLIAAKTETFNQAKPVIIAENTADATTDTHSSIFAFDLSLGSTGQQVALLQEQLKKLGFYKSGITTTYFGEITKEAVIAFQIAKGVIAGENDEGAGIVGPQTREILNSLI